MRPTHLIRNLTIILLILSSVTAFSQEGNYQSGARSKAFSDASISFTDHWAAFNNQAGLAFIKYLSVGVYAENRFNISELNAGSIVIAKPFENKNTIALDFYTFNNSSIYTRQKLGLAYAKGIGSSLAFGLQFNLLRTFIDNYGYNISFCGELGLSYKISEKTSFGAHIFNPTAARYSKYEEERIPSVMRLGLGHQIVKTTLIALEIENSSEYDLAIKGGLEYSFSEKLSIQLGVRSQPFTNSFGLAFQAKKIRISISFQYMQVLDSTPGISFDYLAVK